MLSRKYREKHVKGKRWKARRKKTRIWFGQEGDSVVYMHRNRRNGKIYIGYSTRSAFERWTYGEYKGNGVNSYIYRALMKEKRLYEEAGIQSNDVFVGFESRILVDGLSAEDAPKVEEATVAFFKKKGCELYNGTPGGDAPPVMCGDDNPMKRPEVAAKQGETLKEHYKNHPEAREALSKAASKAASERLKNNPGALRGENNPFFGKHHSEETREVMSKRRKELLKNNPELNPNPPKPVEALDQETGYVVLRFDSTISAEMAGFHHSHIAACCNKKPGYKTHKGYIWRYVEDESNQQR